LDRFAVVSRFHRAVFLTDVNVAGMTGSLECADMVEDGSMSARPTNWGRYQPAAT